METKLTRTCNQLRPGFNDFLLVPVAFVGLAVGGAIGAFIQGPIALVALFSGTFGFPLLVSYFGSRDGRLSDDDCRTLLEAAETPFEQVLIREMYCEKGCLMRSDANRILSKVQHQQHADLQLRMGCAK